VIVYDLKCEKGHKFEGWFKCRTAFEDQRSQKLITCPICESSEIEMIFPTVSVMGKDAGEPRERDLRDLSPMKALQLFHKYLDKNFDDVGDKFAEAALKIHKGEEDRRNIKGTTTSDEEEELKREGVQFTKIPVPKFDS